MNSRNSGFGTGLSCRFAAPFRRLALVAVGDSEPLVRQAYTEERRSLNRRVEVLVTEDLIDDYAGTTPAEELKESSDGR